MPKILIDGKELEAAEGPNRLKVWPPDSLEPTIRAYRRRAGQKDGWTNLANEMPAIRKAAHHHRGRPRGGGLKQFLDNINQAGNGGKR